MSQQPEFAVMVEKEGDVVETAVAANRVTFDITSQTGIGGAAVKLTAGAWPEVILFRLHLSGLESFQFAYGDAIVAVSVSSGGEHLVLESVTRAGEQQPTVEGSAFYMPVRLETSDGEADIPLTDGYFEIQAPSDFVTGEYDSFSINWIDFYR